MLVGAQPKDHFKENYFVTSDLVGRFGFVSPENSKFIFIKYLTLIEIILPKSEKSNGVKIEVAQLNW
jgi:hypothetical protein